MAYRPSKRAKHGFEWIHTNITPMMNLMVVLIPLLLTSAEFVKLGVIQLNLPPAAVGPEGEKLNELPIEDIKRLDLTVTITNKGFFISSSMAVLSGEREGEPTIPLIMAQNDSMVHDYGSLSEKLYEIRKKAENRFPDYDRIIILAEPDIVYQTIVNTMDAARSIKINGKRQSLFPNVLLSAEVR